MLAALAMVVIAGIFFYNVRRNYVMPDDAFISFRYADHLARGLGLVWNPGERVEGYSNFLWVLLLSAGMRLGVAPQVTSTVLNTVSGVALLAGIFLLSARFHGRWSPLAWLPVLVLVTSASFTAWCSGGLATMFFAALVFFAYMAFLREREQRSARLYPSTLLFAVATLTRPEGALHFAIAGLFFLFDLSRRKRRPAAALVWGLPWALVVGAHLLWRHSYYGFWLPNTYYAKVGGELSWAQSLKYFQSFSQMYHLEWFLPLALLAVFYRPRYVHVLFAAAVGLHTLYVASVGGDYLEFRFLVVVFPYLYWLIAEGIERLGRLGRGKPAALGWRGAAAACAVTFLTTTATGELKGASFKNLFQLGVGTIDFMQLSTDTWTEQGLFLRRLVDEGLLPDDVVLAIGGAGIIPFYSRLPTIDIVGLNDVHVAHSPPDSGIPLAGHRHMASIDYLRQRGVVIWPAVGVTVVFDQPVLDVSDDPLFAGFPPQKPPLPLRIVKAKDRYLIFMTLVPEEKFRQVFERLEILQ